MGEAGAEERRQQGAALLQRADALQVQGRVAESLAGYEAALRLDPDNGSAHANLGLALLACRRPDEAVIHLERAARQLPQVPMVHFNLGNAYKACSRSNEAEASWRQALALQPDMLRACVNLAVHLLAEGREEEAIVLLHRAAQVDPTCVAVWVNLGSVFQGRGRQEEALLCFRRALELDPSQVVAHSNLIFALDQEEGGGAAACLAERRRWDEWHARPLAAKHRPHENPPAPDRRLRVGYVSADFRRHSAAYGLLPVLTSHDPAAVEVSCYAVSSQEDDITRRFQARADRWRRVDGLADEALAELVRSDGIDILVDLSGHTAGNRLLVFARRPAPVQVTAWGYGTGTGLEAMDYLFSDAVLVPPDLERHYVEKVWRLPCALCFEPPAEAPEVGPLPALRNGFVTYGCLNRYSKVTPRALSSWAALLRAVPDARLLLKDPVFDAPSMRQALLSILAGMGVSEDRVMLRGGTSRADHLGAYDDVDLALDPYPHGGGITALEGLWMGVPTVTLRGDFASTRISTSLLAQVGLADRFSVTGEAEYLERAREWATRLDDLASIREGLRARLQGAPACDARAYCRAVEEAYRAMWRRWCETGRAEVAEVRTFPA